MNRLVAVLIAIACLTAPGCITTTTAPDGSVITSEIDLEALGVLLDRLERYQQARDDAQAQEDADAALRWQQRIDAINEAILQLRGGE